jgi:hypothetical protein
MFKDHRSETHCLRDVASKGHVVQGTEYPKLFVRRHIGRGRDNIAPLLLDASRYITSLIIDIPGAQNFPSYIIFLFILTLR